MRTTYKFLFILFASSLAANPQYEYGRQNQASASVSLDEIKALTFTAGKQTTFRRTSPVSQLKCVGGSAFSRTDLYPSTVQCYNVGTDGQNLNKQVKFGATSVSCEGYHDSSDPNVLRGSCGLEYTLDYSGIIKQGRPSSRQHHNPSVETDVVENEGSWIGSLFMIGVLGFIAWGFFKACTSVADGRPASSTSYHHTDYYPSDSSYTTTPDYNPPRPSWTPGFWSGAGGGAAMGYMLGRNQRSSYYSPQRPHAYAPYASNDSYASSSNDDTRTATAFASTNNR
ncbi:transmembrane protein [Planoprotostelium fungivorum]|uniref:Store-operated calcium entry-associated regulatory factor n=1 Tax=Planoprotostelium fungivorum TaxID=1890364 RepID=A0A2P6NZX0_9EUKA|nr:transmembrane protein [Planoprotostelium fungivorum]